jgi:hypothetical protein
MKKIIKWFLGPIRANALKNKIIIRTRTKNGLKPIPKYISTSGQKWKTDINLLHSKTYDEKTGILISDIIKPSIILGTVSFKGLLFPDRRYDRNGNLSAYFML